ncbi:hypothetical protein N431DRAFT_398819 [Stipitochalara longipes BDJ]|nr:hypothetical protein N431DRAFT_398819 [Stipitochalara longipes BDJ]
MAPSLRRKNLVCFYCNKRSDIKYDGFLTQWECAKCDSVNFLDENGEITDPPVATETAAPIDLKYTIPRPDSPSSQGSDPTLFCTTCLKNQHLYTASLAQYHIEIDPDPSQYKELERKYFAYRKSLEKRYPQVCEDCEPRVLERMREAGRTAKADHLRRLMDRSRVRKSASVTQLSVSGFITSTGKWLWYLGLLGQILWNITALVAVVQHDHPEALENVLEPHLISRFEGAIRISTSRAWARSSLFCSISSIWWNPMFKQMNSGFMNHIKGFRDWYKLQFLLVVIRSLFYYNMGTGLFADPFSAVSTGAHIFFPCFVILLAFRANRSLRIDMSPLWATTPERLPNVGPPSGSPNHVVDDMADALDQLVATPTRKSRQPSPQSPPSPITYGLPGYSKRIHPQQISSSGNFPASSQVPQRRTSPSLLEMTQAESVRYLATGELPVHLQHQDSANEVEEMEWSPSQSQSQHRAFNPPRSTQRQMQLFNEAPIGDRPSPFWYRVPPAPVTPAQRLRNPPNQPRLRVSSQETKENFFNNITNRIPENRADVGKLPIPDNESPRQGVEFAQQRFFPPQPPSEAGNTLADLLTSFSLGSSEPEPTSPTQAGSTTRHTCQSLALFLCLFFWNYTLSHSTEHSRNVMMTVMIACALIGIRTILDNTMLRRAGTKMARTEVMGACLGGLEVAAALYGVSQILAGNGYSENCASMGTVLTVGMMVHEIWLAFFGH